MEITTGLTDKDFPGQNQTAKQILIGPPYLEIAGWGQRKS